MGTIIFKSQIATTIEQSKRLLELGLKPETADMVYGYDCTYPYNCHLRILEDGDYISSNIITDRIPAWSYDRLREIIANHYIAYSTDLKTTDYESLINEIGELIKHNELKKDYINVWVNT